ncbi:MAG TPA: Uma2 family endonuclease [Tepidisphaeraceae bacterium]
MTEAEFVDWCDEDTWAEWVDGEVIIMSPVNVPHGQITSFLVHLLRAFVEEHDLGQILLEPVQLRFEQQRSRRSPDIFFLSHEREHQIRDVHIEGAPDLIVEIISPNSQSRDRREKFLEYQSAGVREYWIVDPLSSTIEAYTLAKNKKLQPILPQADRIASLVLSGFYLKPAWLFGAKFPRVSALLREMARKR